LQDLRRSNRKKRGERDGSGTRKGELPTGLGQKRRKVIVKRGPNWKRDSGIIKGKH